MFVRCLFAALVILTALFYGKINPVMFLVAFLGRQELAPLPIFGWPPLETFDNNFALCARHQPDNNLVTLNKEFRLSYIADLVARKLAGPEKSKLADADVAFHESEYERLRGELQAAHDSSKLPELPGEQTRSALNDLLVRVRLRRSTA